ncbi:MAG TPA: hypothetical protein H9673_01665 [Candidatus Adamsella sp.]|nr:hypothetical protein [Candidatus Adamsella sp.]
MLEFDATAIVIAISFIVFMLIMNAIFYKPLLKLQDEREDYIENNKQQAQNYQNEAQGLLSEHNEIIKQTKKQAKDIISDVLEKAKKEKGEKVAEANQQASEKIRNFHDEMAVAKTQLKDSLSNDMYEIASQISAKILGEEIPLIVNNQDKR